MQHSRAVVEIHSLNGMSQSFSHMTTNLMTKGPNFNHRMITEQMPFAVENHERYWLKKVSVECEDFLFVKIVVI